MKPITLPLSDTQATLEIVGGKGMSLEKMIRVGSPVPDGFLITTDAYRACVDSNNLQTKILSSLKDVESSIPATLQAVSARLAESSLKPPSPLTLIALLLSGLEWKIVTISWNEYTRPQRMIALGRYAVTLHLVTGLFFAASSLVTQIGEAG